MQEHDNFGVGRRCILCDGDCREPRQRQRRECECGALLSLSVISAGNVYSPFDLKCTLLNAGPASLPLISYVSFPRYSLVMTPMAWRAMRNTETLIGTLTIASPKRGTLPPASLTPVAKRLPCTFIVTDTPLKSSGKSLGFWIRSFTSIRNSRPSP